ncbi:MAG TPA: helix-turn-helix transcriptional regulator [bacterium]|nr:helix-turn-helix transcriptional regulator [bacterium]
MAPRIPPQDLNAYVVRLGKKSYVLLRYSGVPEEGPVRLTPAERRVALALLQGLSNREIGDLRGSSPRTVANQIASIYRKMGVRSRAELASRWSRRLSLAAVDHE